MGNTENKIGMRAYDIIHTYGPRPTEIDHSLTNEEQFGKLHEAFYRRKSATNDDFPSELPEIDWGKPKQASHKQTTYSFSFFMPRPLCC